MYLTKRDSVIPSLLSDLLDREWFPMPSSSFDGQSLPAVNIRETNDAFALELAAPGMKKEDFKIDLDQRVLTVSAERKEEKKEEKDGKYTRREFSYHSFRRSFTLPLSADPEKISASYKDGVLHIEVAKKEEAKPRPARMISVE